MRQPVPLDYYPHKDLRCWSWEICQGFSPLSPNPLPPGLVQALLWATETRVAIVSQPNQTLFHQPLRTPHTSHHIAPPSFSSFTA